MIHIQWVKTGSDCKRRKKESCDSNSKLPLRGVMRRIFLVPPFLLIYRVIKILKRRSSVCRSDLVRQHYVQSLSHIIISSFIIFIIFIFGM